MAVRKIDLMHMMFGYSDGICRECSNFQRELYRDRKYSKCKVYGVTASEGSDWNGTYDACGMKNREYKERPVICMVRKDRKAIDEIPGQISMWEDK